MTKTEIQERLDKQTFEPFRVNVAYGKHYDVVDPRLAVAMDTRLFIALPDNRWTLIALRHVTSLEDLQAA
jgi:hypothetical protein